MNQIDPDPAAPAQGAVEDVVHLSGEIKEEGVLASLVSSFRDVFFPTKLPPLVLESKPIAVPDRMATKRSPTSTAIAVGAHVLVFLLIALCARQGKRHNPQRSPSATHCS
jgi:periplasmic protein TonB